MRKGLIILNGFVHDFAAGLWAATVLAVFWLDRTERSAGAAAPAIEAVEQRLFWLGVASTVAVFATGAGRGFTYVEDYYGPDAESRRRKMLLVKHLLLLAVFGAGTYWQFRMAFH